MKTLGLCVVGMCFVLLLPEACLSQKTSTSSPIVLIPGITGSRLQARDENFFCNTFGRSVNLWVSLTRLLLLNQCAEEELKLVYDEETDSFQDSEDVTITVPGFGGTEGVEFLTPGDKVNLVPYMNDLVEYFVERGYVRGESIRAAPYDWRLAADELEKRNYYKNLKTLIEDTYQKNGQNKVTIVIHSMGGPVSLHFLTGYSGIDQNWKDTHINAWVTLSGAWSGGVAALQVLTTGAEKLPSFLMSANSKLSEFIVPIARTFESIPWLLPRSSIFGDTVLVSTPSRDYTANDYEKLFSDIGYTNGFKTYQRVSGINVDFPAPNVPTYCYYGVNVDTPSKFEFGDNLDDSNLIGTTPTMVRFGDGDGTVNLESSEICRRWSTMSRKYPFKYRKFNEVSHADMISNTRVLADIASIVRAPPPTTHLSV